MLKTVKKSENDKIDQGNDQGKSDEYTTMFFVFDSVLESSDIQSQTAIQIFKHIQDQTLQ